MVKDNDKDTFEGDALLFDDDKDTTKSEKKISTKKVKNVEEKDSKVIKSNSKNHIENKQNKKVRKMANNDEFVIRIKKPGKLFLERLAWVIVVIILLIFALRGGIGGSTGVEDNSSAIDNVEIVGADDSTTELEAEVEEIEETEPEEDEVTSEEEELAAAIMEELTSEPECEGDEPEIKINAISSNDKELTKISLKITVGEDDLKGYGIYLGAQIPDTSNYIKIIPSSNSDGIKYYTSTLEKCDTKTLTFSTFSPKYYSDDDETEFKVQLYDADGDKLDYYTKSHDFS